MKYRFISDQNARFGISELCEALEVSRSCYYQWERGGVSVHDHEDQILQSAIGNIYRQSKQRYGHRPVYAHLCEEGYECGRDRTLRLMKEMKIQCVQKKRFKPIGTDSRHGFGYQPNLLKGMGKPQGCNQILVADTTYLLTEKKWMYLATVMDLWSRRIIGWSISASNNTELVCKALKNAVQTRGNIPKGIIHHSDRGSTYASYEYQNLLETYGMKSSMSAKGNCYDNAAMESFYGRYKSSSVRDLVFVDESELRANAFEYIELFYNRFRKHSSLEYQSPLQFEEKSLPPMGGKEKEPCNSNN